MPDITPFPAAEDDAPAFADLPAACRELPDEVLDLIAGAMMRPGPGELTYYLPDGTSYWDPYF